MSPTKWPSARPPPATSGRRARRAGSLRGFPIIVNLRNPLDRAYSQYLQTLALGRTRRSFSEEIAESMQRDPEEFNGTWPLLEFGCYHEQLTRYLGEFPRSQVHISLYEDLERESARLLSDLFAFLGVNPLYNVDDSARHHEPAVPRLTATAYLLKRARIWPYLRSLAPRPLGPRLRSLLVRSRASLTMDAADRAFLVDYYRGEIEKLATLLDRDLSAWLGPVRQQSKTHGTRIPLAD
jgi:Sulfotransferase domain